MRTVMVEFNHNNIENAIVKINKDGIDITDTSFHGHGVRASANELIKALGCDPYEYSGSKTNFEWDMEITTSNGDTFVASLYDYKENDMTMDRMVDFNIGTKTEEQSVIAKKCIMCLMCSA